MVYSSMIAGLIFILILIFLKRDLLIKRFSVNITSPTSQFQEQLEQTGDIVIKRLEEKIVHLESLLEEANEKMISLEDKIQVADKILDKEFYENESIHLTYLLEQANEKLISLNEKIEIADKILDKVHNEKNDSSVNVTDVTHEEHVKKEMIDLNIELYRDLPRKDKGNLIIEMADLGYDITEIAQATGISKGEIMLLLQLNKK